MTSDRPIDPELTGIALTARADVLLRLGRYPEAGEMLARAVAADPSAARPHGLLALVLSRTSQIHRSVEEADRTASLAPDDPWVHRVRSEVLLKANSPKPALEAADQAVRLDPGQALNHLAVVPAALRCKARDRAEAAAALAVKLSPDTSGPHYAAGSVAMARRRWRDAEEAYRRSLALDPTNWAAANDLGVALIRQRKRSEALDLFITTARLNPRLKLGRRNAITVGIVALHLSRRGRACLLAASCVGLAFGTIGVLAAVSALIIVPELVYWTRWARLDPRVRAAVRDHLRSLTSAMRMARVALVGVFLLVPEILLLPAALTVTGDVSGATWILGVYGAFLYVLYASPHAALLPQTLGPLDEGLGPGGAPPPGWAWDPLKHHRYRFWDGRRWTSRVTDDGQTERDDPQLPFGVPGSTREVPEI